MYLWQNVKTFRGFSFEFKECLPCSDIDVDGSLGKEKNNVLKVLALFCSETFFEK